MATGRNPDKVAAAFDAHDDLATVALDVTDPASAQAAVQAAVDRFGRLDVVVNNAGNFNAGFFEELTPGAFRAQIETTFFGPVNVARAALPILRGQRSGLLLTVSSTAGIVGGEFLSAYAASKFAVEGFMESVAPRSPRSDPHHDRRARFLPYRAAQPGVDTDTPTPRSRTTPSEPTRLALVRSA